MSRSLPWPCLLVGASRGFGEDPRGASAYEHLDTGTQAELALSCPRHLGLDRVGQAVHLQLHPNDWSEQAEMQDAGAHAVAARTAGDDLDVLGPHVSQPALDLLDGCRIDAELLVPDLGPAAGDGAGQAVHVAQELVDERGRRMVVDLLGRADLLDMAVAHHHHPVGELKRLLLVVGDEDRGQAHLVVQPPQPAPQLLAHLCIQRAERLVEQQHARLDRQRPGQRHPLPLAARELGGVAVCEAVELNELQEAHDPPAELRLDRARAGAA